MEKIKKVILMLLSIFLLNISIDVTRVSAQESRKYQVSYEFVMEDGSKVPQILLEILPEKQDVESGTLIRNKTFEAVEDEDVIYEFLRWDNDDFELVNDIVCKGIWKTSLKEKTEKKLVRYDFVEYGKLDGGDLPDEIRKLVPEKQYIDVNAEPELVSFPETSGYRFLGWEAGVSYEDGSSLYFGVWGRNKPLGGITLQSIERPNREADKKITSDGTPVGIPGSKVPHQKLDDEDAFCYEPDVTGYANPTHSYWHVETLTGKAAAIIGMGKLNKMPYGAIQAALWNYLRGEVYYRFGNYEVDPDADVYSRKGLYDCTAAVYATYRTSEGAIQDLIMSGGCTLRSTKGNAKVIKKAEETSFDYLSKCPNNYTLADAEYGVYSDEGCTKKVATLTTKKDGNSNSVSLDPGKYYIKEIKASRGFMLDENIYECVVKTNATTSVTSIERPISTIFDPILYKVDYLTKESEDVFEEAEFTLKYYDAVDGNAGNANVIYSWVFRPMFFEGKARIVFDEDHLISGDKELFIDGVLNLPLGVFTLEENKAPEGYARDNEIYSGRIYQEDEKAVISIESKGSLEIEEDRWIFNEKPKSVKISLQKKDTETGKNEAQGFATLAGAEFAVYRLDDDKKVYVGKIITDEQGKGNICEDEDGVLLKAGKYHIKETKAPDGYLLNEDEFEIETVLAEGDEAVNEYEIVVEEKVTTVTIHKKDHEGRYLKDAELELLDDEGNVIASWITDDQEKVIKGLTAGKKYILHEKEAPEGYMLAKDIDIMITTKADIEIEMIDGIAAIFTSAHFKETGDKNYVADGIAHIIDIVEYEWLYPDRQYVMKGQLIDKGKENEKLEEVILEVEKTFIPKDSSGTIEMEYVIDLDNYANHDFVVYEQLYILDPEEKLVCQHSEYDDEGQSVHVGELYTAEMVLYKVGNNNQKNKLNGAYYSIRTSRTKKDGTAVEKDLGIHLTGGIFLRSDKEFTAVLYTDKELKNKVKEYKSIYDRHFKTQAISMLNLDEGTYYVKRSDSDIIESYDTAKGAIILKDQPEDTNITYTEVKAPNSYHIDSKPYTFSVGHDSEKSVLENYRSNTSIFIPITGVD